MRIADATPYGKEFWNRFVREHYPPIGAFMQTWEWGAFQEALARPIERWFVLDGEEPVAAFAPARHALPLGFAYGYAPRGPVIASSHATDERIADVLHAIQAWANERFPELLFLRLEPPIASLPRIVKTGTFRLPRYYIQPRYNTAIPLAGSEDEVFARFHTSTRSNIRRAEKRGVTTTLEPAMDRAGIEEFLAMSRDTLRRNEGKNAYPGGSYFRALIATVPPLGNPRRPDALQLGVWYGRHANEPAAVHFVLFFGDTATYLFGATYTNHLHSKVATYLHWSAMQEAKRRGFSFYDLGGIDAARWPTLTTFKRQFRGKEFEYIGNVDIPIRPVLYRIYNFARSLRKPL